MSQTRSAGNPRRGHITKKGYVRVRDPRSGKQKMEHRLVWEDAHGPIPSGCQIHHINEDKTDNRLCNLQLIDPLTHKRLHSGCKLVDGSWHKPCRQCGEFYPVDHYYTRKDGSPYSYCRSCHIAAVVEAKRNRKQRERASRDRPVALD